MAKEELKQEEKDKYSAFIAEVSEILGLGKPIDVLKLCMTVDRFFKPYQKRIAELEAQIEKMKCCYNCKHSRTDYEHCITNKHEKWEMIEK